VHHDGIGNHMRVVLVEDAPFLRYAFGRLLRMYGFDVREAVDGREGLDCVAEFHPHLVLTDLMMPVMDGVELIKRLHEDPATANLPVVAITADATEQAERQAREAGAIDVITKPIDLPALLERLRELEVLDPAAITGAIPTGGLP
jgi:two-component system cell cycle response regulator DivK